MILIDYFVVRLIQFHKSTPVDMDCGRSEMSFRTAESNAPVPALGLSVRLKQVLDVGGKHDADGNERNAMGPSEDRLDKAVSTIAEIMKKVVTLVTMEPNLIPAPKFINMASIGAVEDEEERQHQNQVEMREFGERKRALGAELVQSVSALEEM